MKRTAPFPRRKLSRGKEPDKETGKTTGKSYWLLATGNLRLPLKMFSLHNFISWTRGGLTVDLFAGITTGLAAGFIFTAMAFMSYGANAASTDNPLADVEFKPGMSQEEIQNVINSKFPPLTGDQEWGCTCLLCLANPNGWKSVSECRPPVKKLFRHLRKHKPMPRCPQADESQNFIKFIFNPTNPCSKMGLNDVTGYVAENRFKYYLSESYQGEGTSYCAGDFQYSYRRCVERDEGTCVRHITIKVYDQVVKNPEYDPYALDVTIEGKFWHRVHEY